MKFYYNGKLIRTSKTHVYNWAIIDPTDGGVYACRRDRSGAESEYNRLLRAGCAPEKVEIVPLEAK